MHGVNPDSGLIPLVRDSVIVSGKLVYIGRDFLSLRLM